MKTNNLIELKALLAKELEANAEYVEVETEENLYETTAEFRARLTNLPLAYLGTAQVLIVEQDGLYNLESVEWSHMPDAWNSELNCQFFSKGFDSLQEAIDFTHSVLVKIETANAPAE